MTSKKWRRAKSKRRPSNAPAARSAPAEQGASIAPLEVVVEPAEDLEFDHHFFDSQAPKIEVPPEPEEGGPRVAQKLSATAAQRRAQLARYVRGAVAFAAAVCLAALGKAMLGRNAPEAYAAGRSPPSTPVTTSAAETAAPTVVSEAVTVQVVQAPAVSTTPVEADRQEASHAKTAARNALERGKIAEAIETGERLVALDPADSEAWLLLGAAYQEKGDMKNARRCYKSCVDEGKRGSKADCVAMLR
jgi:tetratricopeptide (TPR) repeat protein